MVCCARVMVAMRCDASGADPKGVVVVSRRKEVEAAVVFGIEWMVGWMGTKGRLWKRSGKWRRYVMSDAKNGNGGRWWW